MTKTFRFLIPVGAFLAGVLLMVWVKGQEKPPLPTFSFIWSTFNDRPIDFKGPEFYNKDENEEKTELTVYQKQALLQILKDSPGKEKLVIPDNGNCSMEEIGVTAVRVDLNDDGDKEYIVLPIQACGTFLRGASGNGPIFVLRWVDNSWKELGLFYGNSYAIAGLTLVRNGYRHIITNNHHSALTGSQTLYKWQTINNGTKADGRYEEFFTRNYDLSRGKNPF